MHKVFIFLKFGKRIVGCEDEEFRTISNLPFTYRINGNSLCPSRR